MRFNFLSLIISLIQYAINCEDNVMETGNNKKIEEKGFELYGGFKDDVFRPTQA